MVQSQARVLVVDDSPQVGWDLQEILEPQGYHVQVASGVGQDLIAHAVDLARGFRPHVAIVDVRLLEHTGDRSGLQLLDNLRSARCILYSGHLTAEVTRMAHRYGSVSWVSKAEPPQQLVDAVAEAARQSCASCSVLSISSSWPSERIIYALFGRDTKVPSESVDDILLQLFPERKKLTLHPVGEEAITPLQVSRGRSVVLKAQPDDLEPVIVKLGPVERIQSEEANYREHIKDRLVGRFHAQLEWAVKFWDLGGAVYSFLGSSLNAPSPFTDFYHKENDPETILKPLRYFFNEVWSRHYGRPLPDKPASLFQVYDESLHLQKRLSELRDQKDSITLPGLSVSVINPVSWFLRHVNDSGIPGVRLAVTHGDLHGDNFFVDNEHAWAIDFERTGAGHILRDFIELEIDIITRLVPVSNCAQFYELALVLAEPSDPTISLQPTARLLANSETRKALEVIAKLRSLAYDVTRYTDAREYLWGLLSDALFAVALSSEETVQRFRALLLASVLCERLQHWGMAWPSANVKAIMQVLDEPSSEWTNRA